MKPTYKDKLREGMKEKVESQSDESVTHMTDVDCSDIPHHQAAE